MDDREIKNLAKELNQATNNFTAEAKIVINIDPKSLLSIETQLDKLKDRKKLFTPAMEGVGDYLRTRVIPGTFAKEGPGWKHLAKRTQRERMAQGYDPKHPILVRTSDLFKELTEKSHPKHIENIKIGKTITFELSGSSKKFIENQLGRPDLHLPARPMIPGTNGMALADKDRQQMQKIVQNAITTALTKDTL